MKASPNINIFILYFEIQNKLDDLLKKYLYFVVYIFQEIFTVK